MTELSSLCEKITKDCDSIRRSLIVIYAEVGFCFLVGIFVAGVGFGKHLC
jgi:hypothetical protein